MARYTSREARPSHTPSPVAQKAVRAHVSGAGSTESAPRALVELSGFVRAVQKHGPDSTVQAHLQGLSKAEKALLVVDMLNVHGEQAELIGVIVAHLWENYVIPEKLWEHYEGGESRFKKDIAYDEFVAPTLETAKISQRRKARYIARLESRWGAGWERIIDVHTDHPSILSEHYLRSMAKLAGNGMTLVDAQLVIQHVMKTRISNRGKGIRSRRSIIASDIQKVVWAVTAVCHSRNIEPEECSPTQLIVCLDAANTAGQQVMEVDAPRIEQNSPALADSPPSRARPFTVEIPADSPPSIAQPFAVETPAHSPPSRAQPFAVEIPARTFSPGTYQQIRPVTPDRRSPAPHGLPSPSTTPMSKRFWSLPYKRNIDVDLGPMSGGADDQVPSPIESPAQSPGQSQAHGDVSDAPLAVIPFLQEAASARPIPSSPSPVLSPLARTPDVNTYMAEHLSREQQEPALHSPAGVFRSASFSPCAAGPSLSPVSSGISSPGSLGSRAVSPVYYSFPPSPSPSTVPNITTQPHALPTSNDSPGVGLSELPIESLGFTLSPPALRPMDPMTRSVRLVSNTPPPKSPVPLRGKKRHYSGSQSGPRSIYQTYFFKLPDNWADCTPVGRALDKRGFYKGTDIMNFASASCRGSILDELHVYHRFTGPTDDVRMYNCFHSLVQQALVQSPQMYLTALAAMETRNYRLMSLPVPLIAFPGFHDSKLMDPTFPFAQYLESEKNIPGTRLLCALDSANLRIATSLRTEMEVSRWWDKSGGDLKVAASQLPLEEFTTVHLVAGEFIVIPPQLLWFAEACTMKDSSSSSSAPRSRFVEVRYISVTAQGNLDFDYWPDGTYDEISRYNRDLLAPTVTGWGGDTAKGGNRFRGAIEMRGVWAIGDALLGLMSWRSPLVQLELRQLFDAPPGHWFNNQFVKDVQTRFDEKLANIMRTLDPLHKRAFGSPK